MRIYQLTSVGQSIGANPTSELTPAMRVIYFLRKHGGRATDEQITMYAGVDAAKLQTIMRTLTRGSNPAVMVVGG